MERRKDSKGRVLNNGESQRSDGRYSYQYTDIDGSRKVVYSWKLTAGDKTPNGKRKDLSLREKEKEINDALSKGVVTNGGNMTVLELAERYVNQKKGVKTGTKAIYKYYTNLIKKYNIANVRIDKIKLIHAKGLVIKLQEDGKSYRTVSMFKSFLRSVFDMAIDSDLIAKNPFMFDISSTIKNNTEKRTSLTVDQQARFLDFVKNDKYYKKYYNAIYILLKTGMRISELCGLTINDIDLDSRLVHIKRQLLVDGEKINGRWNRYINTLKSSAGARSIPLKDDVADCFKQEVASRNKLKIEPIIDGVYGFIFLTKDGMPTHAHTWEHRFRKIVCKYNKLNVEPLPQITPHICRHTFCSDQINMGINVKVLQYIMGHADVQMTMNTYSHVHIEDVKEQFFITENGRSVI